MLLKSFLVWPCVSIFIYQITCSPPHIYVVVTAFLKWQGPRFSLSHVSRLSLGEDGTLGTAWAGAGRAPAGWVLGHGPAGSRTAQGDSAGSERPRGMHPAWPPATAALPEPARSREVCEELGRSRNICDVNLALIKEGISCPAHKWFVLPAADEEPQRLRQRIRPFPQLSEDPGFPKLFFFSQYWAQG